MSFHLTKAGRRGDILAQRLAPDRLQVLEGIPYYRLLPPADQRELQDHIKIFLAEKSFQGVGIVPTDAMAVAVAAHACVLLLHRTTDYFPRLDGVVLYPTAFTSEIRESLGGGAIMSSQVARVGESNASTGMLVLAWDQAAADMQLVGNGKDVVFHEFAHQLDGEDGVVDGAPKLPSRERYGAWAKVLGMEYAALDAALEHHAASWIDPYALTNPAEFFAVATEMFFKAPRRLRAHSSALYAQFAAYFQQDPAAFVP